MISDCDIKEKQQLAHWWQDQYYLSLCFVAQTEGTTSKRRRWAPELLLKGAHRSPSCPYACLNIGLAGQSYVPLGLIHCFTAQLDDVLGKARYPVERLKVILFKSGFRKSRSFLFCLQDVLVFIIVVTEHLLVKGVHLCEDGNNGNFRPKCRNE